MRRYSVLAAAILGAASVMAVAPMARAGEALPQVLAQQLDQQPLHFAMSEAKRERMMIIQENMARQRYYGRGDGYGRGYGPGYGYGRRYGGPPPWAPAYGYRRQYDDRW